MTDHVWDAIVIGAGPSGSVCAEALARAGHRVVVLERDAAPGHSANCTGILGLEAFQRFRLSNDLVVNEMRRLRFLGPFGEHLDFPADAPLARVVRRRLLDPYLAGRALDAGAAIRTRRRVRFARRDAGGVAVACQRPGESRFAPLEMFRGRSLVVAIGYNAPLLRALGLSAPATIVQGVQLTCPTRTRPGGVASSDLEQVLVFVGECHVPGSFGWAVPLEPGWVKVGVAARRGGREHLAKLLEHPLLAHRLDLGAGRLRASAIPLGQAAASVTDRVVVVGEAAGQVKTTSHGGIYYGMLGARAAAEVLGSALQADDLSAARLAAYERGWRTVLEPEIREGQRLRRQWAQISDGQLAALMRVARFPGVMRFIRSRADFDWHRPLIRGARAHGLMPGFARAPVAAPIREPAPRPPVAVGASAPPA